MEPVERIVGVDRELSRRPGYRSTWRVGPFPHTRYPPVRQEGEPAAPLHGRPGKRMPPVFGTACPPRGLSGAIRKAAYRYPDHELPHWMLLLFADRVEAMGPRLRRLAPLALPAGAALGFLAMRRRGDRSEGERRQIRRRAAILEPAPVY